VTDVYSRDTTTCIQETAYGAVVTYKLCVTVILPHTTVRP